jgi:hypothetical protein
MKIGRSRLLITTLGGFALLIFWSVWRGSGAGPGIRLASALGREAAVNGLYSIKRGGAILFTQSQALQS